VIRLLAGSILQQGEQAGVRVRLQAGRDARIVMRNPGMLTRLHWLALVVKIEDLLILNL
jgi:hypothetical protein